MRIIEEVTREYGVSKEYCCGVLQLDPRRHGRWLAHDRRYETLKPGPKKAPHALLPEERERILKMAKDDAYTDLSHRQLAIVASEEGIVEASPSTFYREMKKAKLMDHRAQRTPRSPQEKPEIKPEGPHQCWSWDLSYIALGPFFVYLFAIIDVYSRKIVGWHLSFNATVRAMKVAWDKALTAEGLLDVLGAPQLPTALSDHGVQMAKKTAKQFFRDLGIKQLFARYQTPEDNAWIESWFRILKYDWLRFKDYVSFDQLKAFIEAFIRYYNHDRYHGAIEYVTPEQKHSGKASQILALRKERMKRTREKRLAINRSLNNQIRWAKAA